MAGSPLPAPATLALLDGVPTYGTGLEAELVTPTGATLLTTMVSRFGPRPAMTIQTTGHGAGGRDLPDRPNLLRLTLGRTDNQPGKEVLMMAETNIDDMNPEIFPFVLEKLFSAGAFGRLVDSDPDEKGTPGHPTRLSDPTRRFVAIDGPGHDRNHHPGAQNLSGGSFLPAPGIRGCGYTLGNHEGQKKPFIRAWSGCCPNMRNAAGLRKGNPSRFARFMPFSAGCDTGLCDVEREFYK